MEYCSVKWIQDSASWNLFQFLVLEVEHMRDILARVNGFVKIILNLKIIVYNRISNEELLRFKAQLKSTYQHDDVPVS